jgi:tetratricopeptide (TPR) repeat protein
MTHSMFRPIVALTLGLALIMPPAGSRAQTLDNADAGAYLAARSAAISQDYRQGAYWFGRALAADPDNLGLLDGMVVSNIATGDLEAAATAAEHLVSLGGRSIGGNMALLVRDGANEDYEALLSAPKEREIGNLMDQLVKAWAQLGAGKMSEAIEAFDAVIKTDKAFGLYHKALSLAAVGDFEGADAILSGRAAGPLVVNRRGVLAHVQILSQLEKPQEALDLLDKAFGNDPDPQIAALRADLTAGKPLPYDSVTSSRQGIAEVMFTIAAALNGQADDSYTLLYARSAVYLNPGHTEALLMTAGLLDQLQQSELAAEAYGSIPPDHPAYHNAQIGLADALHKLGREDEAIAALKALTESHGDLPVVYLAYGDALRRLERFDESATAYGEALARIGTIEPRHWSLFYSRGISLERAGDWPGAEADLRKALELNPDQPQVLNYLGYSYVDRGTNLDEALGMIKRAVTAQPDSGFIIDSLAWAYYRLGRYQDAVEPMERASLLEPVDPIVTDHLGDIYWAVGRQLEARFQWRRALSFEPEEKEAIRIRRKLEVGLDVVLKEEGAPALTPADAADANN